MKLVRKIQEQLPENRRPNKFDMKDGCMYVKNKLFIPEEISFGVILHEHIRLGHVMGVDAELESTWSKFAFEVLKDEIKKRIAYIKNICLHCDGFPGLIRRPLGEIFHASKPNRVLHSDFLKVYNGYLITLVDDFSKKCLLKYAKRAKSVHVVEALTEWCAFNSLPRDFCYIQTKDLILLVSC